MGNHRTNHKIRILRRRSRRRAQMISIWASHRLTELRSLVSGLAHSTNIRIELGNHWAWSTTARVVYVPHSDLRDLNRCRAISAHEVGHVIFTRQLNTCIIEDTNTQESPLKRGCPALWHMMLNALEDPRVEVGISRLYAGAAVWLEELHLTERRETEACDPGLSPRQPYPCLFFQAHLREYHLGWTELPLNKRSQLSKEIVKRLNLSRSSRQRISQILPDSPALAALPKRQLMEEFAQQVLPRICDSGQRTGLGQTETELRTALAMAKMMSIAETEIWPIVCDLYDLDLRRLQSFLERRGIESESERLSRLPLQQLDALLGEAFSETLYQQDQSIEISPLSRQMLERWYERQVQCNHLDWEQQLAGVGVDGADDPSTNVSRTYSQLKQAIHPQIHHLTSSLSEVLRPQRRYAWREGHRSGSRVNIRQLMQAEARNRGECNFWQRRSECSKRSAAATLLIDLSGSMEGKKSLAALQAAVLFVEALAPLGVPTSVKGFKRRVVPIKEFSDALDQRSRTQIAGMLQQVGSVNNDAKAIRETAQELSQLSVDDRVLIVISDGEPVGENGPNDLRRALQEWEPQISIAGLGIGLGTAHVRRYYSWGKGNIPLEQLSREVGLVLRQALQIGASS